MAADLTTLNDILKEDYILGLRSAINNASPVITEIRRNEEDFVGREYVWPVHDSRNSGVGGRAENEAMPTAGNQGYDDARQRLKYLYATVKLSGPALHLTKNDRGAFIRGLDSEMRGVEKDLKNDVCRQVFGRDSNENDATVRTGTLAVLQTDAGADNVADLDTATTAAEMRYFFIGMKVDIVSAAGVAVVTNRGITAIDTAAKTVTLDGAAFTTTAGDVIVRNGSFNDEILGLRVLINDATGDAVSGTAKTIHNISSATVPLWASVKTGSSTTPISEDLIESTWDKVATDGDGGEPRLWVMAYEQRRALSNKLAALKRFDTNVFELKAGWRALQLSRGHAVVDRYCPDNDAWLIAQDELVWAVGLDFTFDEDDGQVLFKAFDDSDAVQARIKAYVQLVATNRNSHARVALQAV